jgi:hypothetical protein
MNTGIEIILGWFLWELMSYFVSHPAKDGEPARPPLSVLDTLWYNPGYLK